MIKKLFTLFLFAVVLNGCAINLSSSRFNFDEKVDAVDNYVTSKKYRFIDYSNQYIIYPDYDNELDKRFDYDKKYIVNQNKIVLQANIMKNTFNKGRMYIAIEVALETGEDDVYPQGMQNQPLKLIYDGKTINLDAKQDYGSFLYGAKQFIYSDLYIIKEIVNAKEVILEGRNSNGRKFTKKYTGSDFVQVKEMISIIENVNNILNN